MTQDTFRALKGQPSDEAEAKRQFALAYPSLKIVSTLYDYVDMKWVIEGKGHTGRGKDRVNITQKTHYKIYSPNGYAL